MSGRLPAVPATPEDRDRVIAELSEHFAAGRIELDELERRIDLAVRAQHGLELEALVRDLRQAPVQVPAPRAAASALEARRGRRRSLQVALWSGSRTRGPWTPARNHYAVALMGGIQLDFREAVLPPGVTQVHLFAMWGGIEVIVPPELDVEVTGAAIMGGLDRVSTARPSAEPNAPSLRIHALALMGGIAVKVRPRGGR